MILLVAGQKNYALPRWELGKKAMETILTMVFKIT
jgi:hypothetical protein